MKFSRLALAFLVLGMAGSFTYADDAPSNTFTLSPYAQYQFNSSYGEADVHITRVGADLKDAYIFTPKLQLITTFKFEDSVYDFNNFLHESPGVKSPIDQAILMRLYPALVYAINEKWIVTGGLIGQAAGQSDANFGDSLTYGAVGMVIYRVSDTLSIGGGFVYYTRLEDGSGLLPLGSIDWKFADHWLFTGKGTELRLTYLVEPALNYYVAASYDTREYRLADSGSYSGGVLYDQVIPVRLGVQWLPTDQLTVSGEIGAIAWQQLTFDDSNGHRIVKDHVDPTVYLGFQVSYRF